MTKGNYDVNNYNAGGPPPNDTSFRNCICAMLVFISLCAIIAIVAVVMHSGNSQKANEGGGGPSADAAHGDGFKTTTPHRAPPPYIPSTTTTKRTQIPNMPITTAPTITTPQRVTNKTMVYHRNEDAESVPRANNVTETAYSKQPLVLWTEATSKEADVGGSKTVGDFLQTTASTTSTERVFVNGEKESEKESVIKPSKDKQPLSPSTEAANQGDKITGAKTTASSLNQTEPTEKVFIGVRFGGKESEETNVTKTSEDKQALMPPTEATDQGDGKGNKTMGSKDISQTTAQSVNETESTEEILIGGRFGQKESEMDNTTKASESNQPLIPSTEPTPKEGGDSGNKTTGDKILSPTTAPTVTEGASTAKVLIGGRFAGNDSETKNVTKTSKSDQSLMPATEATIKEGDQTGNQTTGFKIVSPTTASTLTEAASTAKVLIGGRFAGNDSETKNVTKTSKSDQSLMPATEATIKEGDQSGNQTTGYKIVSPTTASTLTEAVSTAKVLIGGIVTGTTNVESTTESYLSSTEDEAESTGNFGVSSPDTTEDISTESSTVAEWSSQATSEDYGSSSMATTELELESSGYSMTTTESELESSGDSEISTTAWEGTTEDLSRNQVIGRNLTEKKRSNEEEEGEEETATEPDLTVTGEWSGDPADTPTASENVMECKPKACAATVSRLFGLMDLSAEPCEDFYGYSCGGTSEDHSETDYRDGVREQLYDVLEKRSQSSFQNYADSFRTFYNSCMQHETGFYYRSRVDTAKKIVKDLGDFILDSKAVVDKSTLTKLLAKLILTKSFPLLKADLVLKEDSSEYILKLTLPDRVLKSDSVLSDWPTWLADERFCHNAEEPQPSGEPINLKDFYSAYKKCRYKYLRYASAFENVLTEMDFFEGLNPYNATQIINEFVFMLEMDVMKQVESIGADEMRRREILQGYEDVTISDLQITCDGIDWLLFYEELTGVTASEYTTIRIFFYDKIKAIMKYLKYNGRKSTLYNILLTMYATDIYENTVLPKHTQNRRQYCLELSTHLFQDVSTHLFLTSSITSELRKQDRLIMGMFDMLRDDLIRAFNSAEWLDDEDKVQLVDRANGLNVALGTSVSDCIAPQVLSRKYDEISQRIGDNYVGNLLLMMENRERSILSLAGSTFDQGQIFCHFLHPFDTEPKSFGTKVIAVPYGAVQKIVADVPGYILVARLGLHLAQQIATQFDPTTIKKEMANILSEDFFETYDQVVDERLPISRIRMVKQNFLEFTTTNLTIDKEISDRSALRLVSDVLDKWENNLDLPWIQKNFTREQIFFITVAQEFCRKVNIIDYMLGVYENEVLPYPIRAEIMLVNSEKFISAFQCPGGTRMKTEEAGKFQFPYLDENFETKRRRKRSWFDVHH